MQLLTSDDVLTLATSAHQLLASPACCWPTYMYFSSNILFIPLSFTMRGIAACVYPVTAHIGLYCQRAWS